ncbi:hypothetical protein [Vreelandella sp. EE27]
MSMTIPMYEKGRSFVMAGGLIKAYEGHKFVHLHLLCQGLECIGKALLLAHDYQKYEPRLKSGFGHDLKLLIDEVDRISIFPLLSSDAVRELKQLNLFYKQHLLRYGSSSDFEVVAQQVSADYLHRELVDMLLVLNNYFKEHEENA